MNDIQFNRKSNFNKSKVIENSNKKKILNTNKKVVTHAYDGEWTNITSTSTLNTYKLMPKEYHLHLQ